MDFSLRNNNNDNIISQIRGQNHEISSEESNYSKLKPNPVCPESFWVLGNFRKNNERFKQVITYGQCSNNTVRRRKLSTEELMRIAGERFIHFSCKKLDGITGVIHPYGSALSTLSPEDTKMVNLAHLLFASAEKVGYKQFDSADRLLTHCECISSESGHPVERVAFLFLKLYDKGSKTETGMSFDTIESDQARDYSGLSSGADITYLVLHQEVPFSMVMQYASILTILENIAVAKKIHVIDLQLRNGIQWIPLIQALSERNSIPAHIFKITALQTTDTKKSEEVGMRLQSYAKSMNIPFVFKVIFVLNMEDLKVESFNIKPGEAVAVYSAVVPRSMIPRPENLQILLRVIQRLRPLIMVVCEVEADHNLPSFVNRFIESLFYFSAWFDSLEDCIDRENQYRMDVERSYFGPGIQNILATEGEDRITRNVKINIWRAFFQRFRMVEIDISKASQNQANLVLLWEFLQYI